MQNKVDKLKQQTHARRERDIEHYDRITTEITNHIRGLVDGEPDGVLRDIFSEIFDLLKQQRNYFIEIIGGPENLPSPSEENL